MIYSWLPLWGKFDVQDTKIVFKGGLVEVQGKPQSLVGNLISNQSFSNGTISADVKFLGNGDSPQGCEIIFHHDPKSGFLANAGIRSYYPFSINYFANNKWNTLAVTGDPGGFDLSRPYNINLSVKGSVAQLKLNGVNVISADLPFAFPISQVGIWCMSNSDIEITNYRIDQTNGTAFVVMQFSDPYDDVYFEVIKKICEEAKLEVLRIDESYAHGLIISDIEQKIRESSLVIADITPANANVYYEVGFAHAIKKPTILLAQKDTKLPFDISGHRILLYDNSIGGKSRLDDGLRAHITAALEPKI